jgi:uncharacterized protein YbjT (DUF2867 family)
VTGPILVVGATGRQGGAVARHLLARRRAVRALTRNPDRAAARALERLGAELVRGDLDDRASLDRATAGVSGVFSVQDPWLHGVESEIRQGKQLAEAAKRAGVEHIVQGSVGYADQPTGIAHFESKGVIEAHIRQLGIRLTSIRPALYMDSLLTQSEPRARFILGATRRGLHGGKVQLAAVDDIGRVAAEAFEAHEIGADQIVELAGDELSFDEILATFTRVTGRKPPIVDLPFAFLRLFNRDAFLNFRWIGEAGWHFDLARLRTERPWLQAFEPWLRSQRLAGNA